MASARQRRTAKTAAMRGGTKLRGGATGTSGGNGVPDNKVAKRTGSKEPASTVPGRRRITKDPTAVKRVGKGGKSSGKKAGATYSASAAKSR